jgi:hypothetical protein
MKHQAAGPELRVTVFRARYSHPISTRKRDSRHEHPDRSLTDRARISKRGESGVGDRHRRRADPPEQPYGTRKPLYWWLLTSRQRTPPRPINVYVIEHAKGLILFDTGQDRASVTDENYFSRGFTGYLYDRLARFDITESDTLSAQLTQLGYAPAGASTAIVSYPHEDHIGGLPELAGANLLVSAAEWASSSFLRGGAMNPLDLWGA